MADVLFRMILSDDFDMMPPAVRHMHNVTRAQDVAGVARVIGGKNILAKAIRWMARLPPPARRTPITIHFTKQGDGEEWNRLFGMNRFHTLMKREGGYLSERMAAFPVTFIYRVNADQKGFRLQVVQVRFLGIPLPRPVVLARAYEWGGRYGFTTSVGFWFCGPVIRYLGYLNAPR